MEFVEMSDGYEGAIDLAWEGDFPSGIDQEVIDDIRISLWGLSHPSSLCFHTVFLSNDHTGPSVHVSGREGSDFFHCEYVAKTEWS